MQYHCIQVLTIMSVYAELIPVLMPVCSLHFVLLDKTVHLRFPQPQYSFSCQLIIWCRHKDHRLRFFHDFHPVFIPSWCVQNINDIEFIVFHLLDQAFWRTDRDLNSNLWMFFPKPLYDFLQFDSAE